MPSLCCWDSYHVVGGFFCDFGANSGCSAQVIDIERLSTFDDVHFKSWDALQFLLTSLDGVKSTRYIYGTPASAKHAGYAVNFQGQVYGIGSVGGGPTLPSFGELLDESA